MHPLLNLIRPRQWIKNLFVMAPLILSSKLLECHSLINSCFAFVIFCLTASSIYILNDLRDIEADSRHPKNRYRPLPSGAVTQKQALLFLFVLLIIEFIVAFFSIMNHFLPLKFYTVILIYYAINISYSFGLKNISLVEMFLVSSSYVLRVLAGCIAINVTPSPWIIIVTALASLLIITGKRRAELIMVKSNEVRKSIKNYNIAFLDSMIAIFSTATIVSYMLFTISAETIQRHHTQNFIYTSIFVIFGITRYVLLVKVHQGAESPTDLITSDIGISLAVLFWIISVLCLIYL